MRITLIGQSTFRLVTSDGAVILTDPWFGGYPWLRVRPPALRPEGLQRVDLMLISHNHIDHVDRHAFRLAARTSAAVVGPRPIARRAKRHGLKNVVGLGLREDHSVGGIRIHTMPADHPLCASPFGFLVQADGLKVYFSGDTRDFPALRSALSRTPPDVALVQIACARYFGKPDGMDVASAAGFLRAVKPKVAVPMHYDGRFKEADPHALSRALEGSAIEVRVFSHGREESL